MSESAKVHFISWTRVSSTLLLIWLIRYRSFSEIWEVLMVALMNRTFYSTDGVELKAIKLKPNHEIKMWIFTIKGNDISSLH